MKHFITCFTFLATLVSFGQDPEFTQFYANPIYLNPALAGTNYCPRVNMNYRDQWANISGAYVTNTVSFDRYVPALHGGIAFMATNDMAGKNTINWSTLSAIYSHHTRITRTVSILVGGQATWNQNFLDWKKLTFGDQIDPYRGFIFQSNDLPINTMKNSSWSTRGFFDVSAGLVVYSERFYAGFAAKHLNEPNRSFTLRNSKLPRRFTGHIGATIPLGENSKYENNTFISPNIIYSYQDRFQQLNFGTYIKHGAFTTGAWLRVGDGFVADAFILTVGIDAKSYRIGYSYDITISELTNASGGAHEISLGLTFGCKAKDDHFRTMICPAF